jgi:quaternary ammonium compound-resistance protein SugE
MPWFLLLLAGLCEIGWAIGLKYTDGFTRLVPTVLTVIALIVSMILLALAVRTLPIGTAYAIWVGIGAFGAAVLGIVLFDESRNPARLAFLALLLIAIVGLKWTTPATTTTD